MKYISLGEIVDSIEEHVTDTLTYRIEITENDHSSCLVRYLEQSNSEHIISLFGDDVYDTLYNYLVSKFKKRASTVKVEPVCSPSYIFIMIDCKACVLFRYKSEKGLAWINNKQI